MQVFPAYRHRATAVLYALSLAAVAAVLGLAAWSVGDTLDAGEIRFTLAVGPWD